MIRFAGSRAINLLYHFSWKQVTSSNGGLDASDSTSLPLLYSEHLPCDGTDHILNKATNGRMPYLDLNARSHPKYRFHPPSSIRFNLNNAGHMKGFPRLDVILSQPLQVARTMILLYENNIAQTSAGAPRSVQMRSPSQPHSPDPLP